MCKGMVWDPGNAAKLGWKTFSLAACTEEREGLFRFCVFPPPLAHFPARCVVGRKSEA